MWCTHHIRGSGKVILSLPRRLSRLTCRYKLWGNLKHDCIRGLCEGAIVSSWAPTWDPKGADIPNLDLAYIVAWAVGVILSYLSSHSMPSSPQWIASTAALFKALRFDLVNYSTTRLKYHIDCEIPIFITSGVYYIVCHTFSFLNYISILPDF